MLPYLYPQKRKKKNINYSITVNSPKIVTWWLLHGIMGFKKNHLTLLFYILKILSSKSFIFCIIRLWKFLFQNKQIKLIRWTNISEIENSLYG